ncbi:MAG: SlyX family protein [Deltaproteobacteria bacterium]|nr:SlyX family protein [Deltaproteobacteria bacterium]
MEERLTELEIKVSYLEKAHDELSEVVRELFEKVASLSAQVRSAGEVTTQAPEPPRTLEDDKPPHY